MVLFLGSNIRKHYTQSWYYPLWAVLADRISKANLKTVLDIGCGSGQLAMLLYDKGIQHYLGLDFSLKRIAWAKKTCPSFDFIVADVFETDLLYSYDYDAIIVTEFLEHVEQDLELIGRMRQGTRLYGTVPNFPSVAHVRYFISQQKVYDRYKKLLRPLSVDTFRGLNSIR